MASISDFTRRFEDREKLLQVLRTRTIFVFLHMSFRINLDTPPEHPFCSDGFFARRSLIQKALVLRAQNIACRYGLAGWLRLFAAPYDHSKVAASPARAVSHLPPGPR